ncbi:hypothetical protein [Chitinophaga qingshengii]|uniref:Uncharacterized protein n=1 Tax=Chitinophaga qingshengii TaxID=1569794 RepID=A0ABR7TGW8_9BACT|nr:hypothetical protein [Chitinophaga qingshengii]MBC9929163.1 hypothetical protein [Chitinophaga qingshengii]
MRTQKFEINQQPFGEPDTKPLKNIVLKRDFSLLTFDAEYRRRETSFSISAANPCERAILAFFAHVNENGFSISESDLDDTQLVFKNGLLFSITIYKNTKEYQLIDSLDIFTEGGALTLMRRDPWEKLKLDKLLLESSNIISQSGDRQFTYHLDMQAFIFDTIKKMIESGGVRL